MIQPSREWLLKMAELEDKHDCISVGGLYAELGFPVNGDGVLRLRSNCHPEANGRRPVVGDVGWTLTIPLEGGGDLELKVGKKGRDLLFGMMIADCTDSDEPEPTEVL
jgi:hypothetical protein